MAVLANVAKRNQTSLYVIPQHKSYAAKTFAQRQATNLAQLRMVSEHVRKPVIWNSAAQMVDVMNTDIGREPAQKHRQIVM